MATFVGEMLSILKSPARGGYSALYGQEPKDVSTVVNTGTKLRDNLLTAKRYHLSSATAKAAAMYAFNVNDPVNDILRLARAPFSNMWIEWPLAAQHDGVGAVPAPDAPLFAGNLVQQDSKNPNRYWLTSVGIAESNGQVQSEVFVSPVSIVYDVLEPINDGEYLDDKSFVHDCIKELRLIIGSNNAKTGDVTVVADTHDLAVTEQVLKAALLGGSESLFDDPEYFGKLFEMTAHARWALTPYFGERFRKAMAGFVDLPDDLRYLRVYVAKRIIETSGMFRFAVGALALLHEKKFTKVTPQAPNTLRPDEVGRKPGVRDMTPNYQFVEFNVPHTVFIRDVQGDEFEAKEKCRHEVAGHYCESHRVGDPDCSHVFTAQSPTRQICLLCGSKRWWRKAHERGNLSLGFKERASRLVVTSA